MNYFSPSSTAERYAKGRPYFHPITIKKLKNFFQLEKKFNLALDVACGTGLSTKALLEIVKKIHASDSSEQMLKWTFKNENITYHIANAETQPFPDKYFDIITVCSGIHWFQIDNFLDEANRILKDNGWLVLYDNFFGAIMKENKNFADWYPEVYLKKFPAPIRNNQYSWNNSSLLPRNFSLIQEDVFDNKIEFSLDELILYFTTQSNISAAIESERYNYKEIEEWLRKELFPFYSNKDKQTLYFKNWIKYLQKID